MQFTYTNNQTYFLTLAIIILIRINQNPYEKSVKPPASQVMPHGETSQDTTQAPCVGSSSDSGVHVSYTNMSLFILTSYFLHVFEKSLQALSRDIFPRVRKAFFIPPNMEHSSVHLNTPIQVWIIIKIINKIHQGKCFA